ncbi:NACHT, LRR and PYD domains-containing protein 3-like [Cetorhinus maximus]
MLDQSANQSDLEFRERGSLVLEERHDEEAQIMEFLSNLRDIDLRRITDFYRQRLEEAIETFVEGVALALLNENLISSKDYQLIRQRVGNEDSKDASKGLLNNVIESGAEAGRALWAIFARMQSTKPKLRGILKEIQAKGLNIYRQHKDKLSTQFPTRIMTNGEKEDTYTDLHVISSPRQRSLNEHEQISRGKEHENWQKLNVKQLLEKIQIDQFFRSSFGHTSLSGTSVLTGVAGIGKTTIVHKIVQEWAAGKIYQQFNFVFLFKFRELNNRTKRTSLDEITTDLYPHFRTNSQAVWKEPNNILIIFDGLDEFKETIDFSDQRRNTAVEHHCFDPESQCEISDIVRCLVQGKLLRGCSVLLTSRPIDLETLDQAGVNLWAEILGFFKEERKYFFQKFFQNKEIADEVFAYVEENDILYTLCFNPCYCFVICSTLKPLFEKKEKNKNSMPKTVTSLFSSYIASLLQRWGCHIDNRRELLLKIGAMAYEGISKKKLIFYNYDFSRHGLEPSQFTSGFMVEILQKDTSTNVVVYTFPHLTIQEFLAALSVFLRSQVQVIENILNEAYSNSDGRYDIFMRFLIGLSASNSTQELQSDLGAFPKNANTQVQNWLKARLEQNFKSAHSMESKKILLNTLYLLFESQNIELMRGLLECMRKTDLGGVRLDILDCSVLATVLEPCVKIKELNLVYCSIETDHIQKLLPVLHKCKMLRLNDNALNDSGVQQLHKALERKDCKIKTLVLTNNNLTDAAIPGLRNALHTNKSLKNLQVLSSENAGDRENKFSDESYSLLKRICKKRRVKIILVADDRLFNYFHSNLNDTVTASTLLRDILANRCLNGKGDIIPYAKAVNLKWFAFREMSHQGKMQVW